jgi:hypothetical protein
MSKAEPSGGNASQVQMEPAENQIVVYQPNETVRLDVRLECCHCVNVASGQFQFPIEEAA